MSGNTRPNSATSNPHKRDEVFWISFALVMVVAAYYPTLVADYVPMDQWRAFRYSLEPGLPLERWTACYPGALKFYFLTGRWLVWLGECAKHAAVARISDFAPLRVIALTIVLLSVIAIRSILVKIFNSPPAATILTVMIVFLPGYAFMYYQGLTGMPVLLALLFSLLSFRFTSRAFTTEGKYKKVYFDLGVGSVLFLSACFIYPIFAFTVIPTAFIFSAFRPESALRDRVYLCAKFCILYAVVAIIYYLTVKSGIAIAEYLGKSIPDLKNYRVDINTSLSDLMVRTNKVFHEANDMALSNFFHLPTWLSIVVFLTPSGIIYFEGQRLGWSLSVRVLAVAIYSISVPIIALASMAPWFLSHFPSIAYRHIMPVHFFFILSFGILLTRGIEAVKKLFSEQTRRRIESTFIFAVIAVFSINQISLSLHQVIESSVEVNYMRAAYREMVESGKFWKSKEIHVVRPAVGRSYDGRPTDREFLPATMANPEHILQMTHAILREILSSDQLQQVNLVDCRFDRNCPRSAPENLIVISQSNFGAPFPELRKNHAIIDYSRLNKAPEFAGQ